MGWSWAGLQGVEGLLPLFLERVCMCWGGAVNGGFFFLGWPKHPPPTPQRNWFSGLWNLVAGDFPVGVASWYVSTSLTSRKLLDP